MTKKELKIKAENIMNNWKFESESGSGEWKHLFYRSERGSLGQISYKNGKLAEVNYLGM